MSAPPSSPPEPSLSFVIEDSPALGSQIELPEDQVWTLWCGQFTDQIENRIVAPRNTVKSLVIGIYRGDESRPIVWHGCAKHSCDLCQMSFGCKSEWEAHCKLDDHIDEIKRQSKFSHFCALCEVTTTSLNNMRDHVQSRKHNRARKQAVMKEQ